MWEELLGLVKWIAILVVCALVYEPLGKIFAGSTFSLVSGYVMAYIAAALVVLALFAGLKRGLGGKLLGSDLFGKAEYYLGMGSGLVRFTCMLLVALALLNPRYFSPEDLKPLATFH